MYYYYLQDNGIDRSVFCNGYIVLLHRKYRFVIIDVLDLDLKLTTRRISFSWWSWVTSIQSKNQNDVTALTFTVEYTVSYDGTCVYEWKWWLSSLLSYVKFHSNLEYRALTHEAWTLPLN